MPCKQLPYHSVSITMFSPARLTSAFNQWKQKEQSEVPAAAMQIAARSGSNTNGQGNKNMVSSCSVSSMTDTNNGPSVAEWWQQRYQTARAEADRLQMFVDGRRRTTERCGLGKNTQTHFLTAAANQTNKTALHNWVRKTLWPHYKILFFKGRWTSYDKQTPHPFAVKVMTAIRMPRSFVGYEREYYEQFVLPTVSAKLSNLRGNFVTACKNTFRSECLLCLSAFFVFGATPSLTHLFMLELHCSCLHFNDVSLSFETLLSFTNTNGGWDALATNDGNDSPAVGQLCHLIYYYASEVYGRTAIKRWLNANQDKSVLDNMTASDIAYAIIVFENYHPRWIDDIKAAREEESKKHEDDAKMNEDEEPPKKKQKTSEMQLKYTKTQSKKMRYLEDGWNSEGRKRLEQLQRMFTKLLQNEVAWQVCKDGWDKYIADMKMNGEQCWVPTYCRQEEEDDHSDDGSGSVGEDEGFDFVLDESAVSEDSGGLDVALSYLEETINVPEVTTSGEGVIQGV